MQYLTIAECLRLDAERHEQNGERYLKDNKPEYAAGSFRKAANFYARACFLENWPLNLRAVIRADNGKHNA